MTVDPDMDLEGKRGEDPGTDQDAACGTGPHRRKASGGSKRGAPADPCIRAENEDDDGYDPYSDRRPASEPMFERDPWD